MTAESPTPSRPTRSGFDVIVGNPPFLNQLETATASTAQMSQLLRCRTSDVIRGYTDLSATFLYASSALLARGGHLALVQPQSMLAARDAKPVRQSILKDNSLTHLWVSNEHVFQDASIFTCAPTLQSKGPRQVEIQKSCRGTIEVLPTEHVDMDVLANEDTWSHLAAEASGLPSIPSTDDGCLGDLAQATADFRDQFYGLDGFLIESESVSPKELNTDSYPKIVTTGLIDLAELKWGSTGTRILKTKWAAPRIDRKAMEQKGTLSSWITSRLVPKVLLATQTKVIEVYVDDLGELVPSIPLITITARSPDHLWLIAAAAASPVTSVWSLRSFAGAALNADAIKLSAKQVARIPLPQDRKVWSEAAKLLETAQYSDCNAMRQDYLTQFGTCICSSYGMTQAMQYDILDWWLRRMPTDKKGACNA